MTLERTVRAEQEERAVGRLAPLDLVDLFLDLLALQVVELGLMALELGEKVVLRQPGGGRGGLRARTGAGAGRRRRERGKA